MKKTIKVAKVGAKKVKEGKAIAYEVFKANGMPVRTYTVELHGDKMKEYAEAFTKGTNLTFKPVFK